tara:strand:- start:60 stop:266 length:207 start_codon:yes stop_codon:yes gene_type:complete
MGTLLNLTHSELKEVYLSLTKGQWKDAEANKSATKKIEKYLIDVAMTCEFKNQNELMTCELKTQEDSK